jgi:3-phytase
MSCAAEPAVSPAVPRSLAWQSVLATQPVSDDPDDPAIWIDPNDPAHSLVIGTNKVAAPNGAVVVFDVDGKILQTIDGIDRPNNVDLRRSVRFGGRTVDLVAVTERNRSALRLFTVEAATHRLVELGAAPVFQGQSGDFAAPMGIAIYRRPTDGAVFAIVGRKSGPEEGYIWQYRVSANSGGGPLLTKVREFGKFSGSGEIEAIVSDDGSGFVYYSDEGAGIRKYKADPDSPDASTELALFGTTDYRGDREGLAIYSTGTQTGFIISTDQIEGGSRYILYAREGVPGNPHRHNPVAVIEPGADATDGIEATSTPLGARFPNGLLVTMNSGSKNFLYFAWSSVSPN